ncbi:MAG: rhodanese-related sulfurtransferase, partial [Sphingomonadales bacterium]|nr:rhodanese-related sulfurtransferase [Sphingomonadales bacterium]
MSSPMPPVSVAALYRFTAFDDPATIRDTLAATSAAHDIKGTLLIAREGINGTIAGDDDAVAAVLSAIRALPGCADLSIKRSRAATMPFYRMKVRVKAEIVTMGQPDLDPARDAGTYVAPADWNSLIDDPATIVIDTRNDYEVAIGSFAGAIDPQTQRFGDFPAWFEANREALTRGAAQPKIAMFCTGGIRCEKATAFVKREGIEQVYHLDGGILAYLEQVAPEDSRWQGECFVFDERVAITHGLEAGTHGLCRACRMPVGPEQRASQLY